MWARLLGACSVAGCGALYGVTGPAADARGSDAAPGPDAIPCVMARGAIYVGPGDADHDGVANECDPCPEDGAVWPGHNDQDLDGDGLPDACDPNVTLGVPDCRVVFDAFDDMSRAQAIDLRWISSPTWQWAIGSDGGRALISPPIVGGTNLYFDATLPTLTRVDIAFTATAVASYSDVSLFADAIVGSPLLGDACDWFADANHMSQGVRVFENGTDLAETDALTPYAPGTAVQLQWLPTGVQATCTEVLPASVTEKHVLAPPSPDPQRVGLQLANIQIGLTRVSAYAACPAQ